MSKKRKQTDAPQRPEDCVTIADKIAFSNAARERWENIPWDAPPSEILNFDKYPMPDPSMPWTHGEWASHYTRAQEEKERVLRRIEKRKTNRLLYRATRQGD